MATMQLAIPPAAEPEEHISLLSSLRLLLVTPISEFLRGHSLKECFTGTSEWSMPELVRKR